MLSVKCDNRYPGPDHLDAQSRDFHRFPVGGRVDGLKAGSHNQVTIMSYFIEKLYTNRLMLRRIQRADLSLLVQWSRSQESCGNFLSPECFELHQLQQKLDSGVLWNPVEKFFIIERRDSTPLGTIHYWQPPGKKDTVQVSVKIADSSERNKGYGTEAQKFLLMYLFDKIGVKYVEMYTDIDNLAQQSCLRKLGFLLVESLTYDDGNIKRTGNLYRLDVSHYSEEPIYRFHYE
jgi:RimJ/RimL family protein N-acetyltransferase